MSIESCITFFREITDSDGLKQHIKATTDTKEIIALGKRHGYTFDTRDLAAASSSFQDKNASLELPPRTKQATSVHSHFYHHEFEIEQLPIFKQVTKELSNLKIKPSTVNLDLYEKSFREDDLRFTSMSPDDPEFGTYYDEIMQTQWQDPRAEHDFSRRDFHLVNLDQHCEHPLYTQYFRAKTRMISFLEDFFESEIRFSGSMWYPPHSYRLWHTNETQPGWRMYLVDFDEPIDTSDETSFFRYMHPQNKEIVTLTERPKIVRFFKIEQEEDKRFWHCIVNATTRNRWSFGFAVPENWMEKFSLTS